MKKTLLAFAALSVAGCATSSTGASSSTPADTFLAALAVAVEQVLRLVKLRTGPAASMFGFVVRPFLRSFLVEARTLASFRHPAIVRVARFFEAHRTAYMVLEYERGSPFKTWWPQHRQQVDERGLAALRE